MIFLNRSLACGGLSDAVLENARGGLKNILSVSREIRVIRVSETLGFVDCEGDGDFLFQDGLFIYLYGNPWVLYEDKVIPIGVQYFFDCCISGKFPQEFEIGGSFFVLVVNRDGAIAVLSDICGGIPLFKYECDDYFCLSVFVYLIKVINISKIKLSLNALVELNEKLRFQEVRSVYKSIARMPPGFWSSNPSSFCDVAPIKRVSSPLGLSDAVHLVTAAVVRECSQIGHRWALCLSGGLDSTLVALCFLRFGKNVSAYSGVFPGLSCDESVAIASFENCVHNSDFVGKLNIKKFNIDLFDAESLYTEFSKHLDFPLFPMAINQCKIIKIAYDDGVRAIYDGNGGDEIFALSPEFAMSKSGYCFLDILVAQFRKLISKPALMNLKSIFRGIGAFAFRESSDVEKLVRDRYFQQGFLHPFYLSLWQFSYLHGVKLVQPFRCSILGGFFLSQAFSRSYFLDGYHRGLQRAMIRKLSGGFILNPYAKVSFGSFISRAYQVRDDEREMFKLLGKCEMDRHAWLVPRFIKNKMEEGYEIDA